MKFFTTCRPNLHSLWDFEWNPFVSSSPNERLGVFTLVGMGTALKSFRC
jgi:hypothetical protein